ncbi:uncharacterized protein METZ01_LOCUS199531, partial [marine metagenome]
QFVQHVQCAVDEVKCGARSVACAPEPALVFYLIISIWMSHLVCTTERGLGFMLPHHLLPRLKWKSASPFPDSVCVYY